MNSAHWKLGWRTSTVWRSFRPSKVFGRSSRNAAEIGRVEFFCRRELPEHRTQVVAQHRRARVEKAGDRVAGFGRARAGWWRSAGPFSAKTKPSGTSLAHLA